MKTRRALALEKEKFNVRFKSVQAQVKLIITKRVEQKARKRMKLATQVKDF